MLLPEKYESIFDVSSEGPSSGSLVNKQKNVPTKGLRSKRRRHFHIFQVEAYLTYCEDKNPYVKNARCPLCQNPRALTSRRASSDELVLPLKASPDKACKGGSISTSYDKHPEVVMQTNLALLHVSCARTLLSYRTSHGQR